MRGQFLFGWRVRGLGYSFGAGGSLVVAALCCLVFVSAMLAFRDWPQRGESSPDGSISMRVPAAKASGRSVADPIAAVPAQAAGAAAPVARDNRSATPRRRSASAPVGSPAPRAVTPVLPPELSAPDPAPAPSQPASPEPTVPVAEPPAAGAPSGPTERVVETGREVVRAIVPPLPPGVQQPVDAVLDVGEGAAGTVDAVTAPLLP